MIRIVALSLGMPEDYFDSITTTPGADGLYVHYPATPTDELKDNNGNFDVGIGSHTDIQCITLLWQDMSGGLQVLSASDEWLDARPISGTLVVNIGDFLQRLSNNRFKSTVHRVYNRQPTSRYSMPFFLGFNPDSICKVVPSCVDETHPALFEPISCGQVRIIPFPTLYVAFTKLYPSGTEPDWNSREQSYLQSVLNGELTLSKRVCL
jgi:isopenicillin N synthase-like dioxygenase